MGEQTAQDSANAVLDCNPQSTITLTYRQPLVSDQICTCDAHHCVCLVCPATIIQLPRKTLLEVFPELSIPTSKAIVGRKLQSLDGLRAIAIILVFLCHMKGQMLVVNPFTFYLNSYAGEGWIGVDLFFVLSGFLITGILLETREASNYFT